MKKTIILLFITCGISFTGYSQWGKIKGKGDIKKQERIFNDPFNGLKVSGAYHVSLVKGDVGKIIINAQDNLLEYIQTEVKNNYLLIKNKKNVTIRSKKPIEIIVFIEDDTIDKLNLAGSGNITSKETLKTNVLITKVTGSGIINIPIKSNNVEGKVTGSGKLILSGKSKKSNFLITGSGSIDAFELKNQKSIAKITGSGLLNVFVNESIDASITGSGNINYKTNNEDNLRIKSNVAGSGKLRKQ